MEKASRMTGLRQLALSTAQAGAPDNPASRGIAGCCARAASGHAAGVANGIVFVEDDQGRLITAQQLGPNENAAGVAQRIHYLPVPMERRCGVRGDECLPPARRLLY